MPEKSEYQVLLQWDSTSDDFDSIQSMPAVFDLRGWLPTLRMKISEKD